ncbi:MAG: sialate O-acetylesterase [Candidatus Latescibacterota bacterium]
MTAAPSAGASSPDPRAAPPASATAAALRLPAVFGDHMVLQAGQPVPVWGRAAPGDSISVSFAGQTARGTGDATGRWRVVLQPLVASATPAVFTVRAGAGDSLVLVDVLVGEVWLASGQSNVGVPLPQAEGGARDLEASHSSLLRLLRIPERVSLEPLPDVRAAWSRATRESLESFSAVGYYFARSLQPELGVPVGVVQAAYGGAVCEAFMSPGALCEPRWAPILQTWERFVRQYPSTPEERARVALERRLKVIAAGHVPPPWPLEPKPPDHFHRPSSLYHGMVHPLVPFALAGVLWYQGEANGWRGHQYRELLPALVADWRRQWGRPDLPFLFVQLPGFAADWLEPDIWPELREAQLLTWQRVPHTAMVGAIDVGDPQDLHPRRKREVGERLALAALATVYGRAVEFSGPVFHGLQREERRLRLCFDHAAGGLVCPGDGVAGFTVAGEDRRFMAAQAVVEGETVVVWSQDVAAPVAARYGWSNAPAVSLYNAAGLPASPFRTDAWPGVTDGRVEPEAY